MDLTVITKGGTKIDARLARPFRCEEGEIAVASVTGVEQQIFALNEICCVLFEGCVNWDELSSSDESTELVEVITGERFEVRVNLGRMHKNGFFGTPVDESLPYRSVFFSFSGVRGRDQRRRVGQILKNQGAITQDGLIAALKDQKDLRTKRLGEIVADSAEISRDVVEETIASAREETRSLKVGELLVEAGLVTADQVQTALASQEAGRKEKIGELLIKTGLISEAQLLSALATKFRMRFVDLKGVIPEEAALRALSDDLARRLRVLPIQSNGKKLVIATSAPTDYSISDILRFSTNRSIELVVATAEQITTAIEKYYVAKERGSQSLGSLIGEMGLEFVTGAEEKPDEAGFAEPDSKVIRLVNEVLIEAASQGASDIHFEPGLGGASFLIRYRVDGECRIAHEIANGFKSAIISRIKILANLDIAEHRKPQSGKILMRYQGKEFEFRVEITPTVGHQEDAVLRLFTASKKLYLESMGFSEVNLEGVKRIISKPYGLVLCVGPTGSGKTTTIHSALAHINHPNRKIWTAEDPVEITQQGIRQVQVNPLIGFSFSDALRSFLRADPDVVMIGEMRDAETAKITIEASLTGHLVFSTLHTNSAPETAVRLIEMGMDRFNFADAILGVLAQRLARRLCDHCKKPRPMSRQDYDVMVEDYGADYFERHALPQYSKDLVLMQSVGCEKCGGVGYKGRLALHELLEASSAVKKGIKERASVEDLKDIGIREGMRTLKMDGIKKVFDGLTDYLQVTKVCL